jgi:hypothetical protein
VSVKGPTGVPSVFFLKLSAFSLPRSVRFLTVPVAFNKPAQHLRLVEPSARAAALDPPHIADDGRCGVAGADTPDPVPAKSVRRCVLCGAKHISSTTEGRFVTVECHACGAMFQVEYDPPDSPNVRGRIELISRRAGPPRAD